MKISVIVSTYNSPLWLEKVIWGYQNQTDNAFELVIADDGSGPPTKALIDRYRKESTFDILHVWHADDGFRKWEIVNRAIEEATGDYLVFTDGDCIPDPQLVATHRKRAEEGRFLSGGYCKLPMSTSEAISREDVVSGRVFTLSWLRAHGYGFTPKWLKVVAPGSFMAPFLNTLSPAAKTFNGNNSSCFKADAMRINGFDNRILYGGGDREFGYRLEHAGLRPKVIRYSTLCLHLDHRRGYKSADVRARNMALIEESRATRRIETPDGIRQIAETIPSRGTKA